MGSTVFGGKTWTIEFVADRDVGVRWATGKLGGEQLHSSKPFGVSWCRQQTNLMVTGTQV